MTQDDQVTLGSIRNVVKQAGKLFRISWILMECSLLILNLTVIDVSVYVGILWAFR